MIAAECSRQSFSNRFDSNEDSLKMEDSVNGVRKKEHDSDVRSSVRCWKCDHKGHKRVESPHREKRKKNRRGDVYEDRRWKHKKMRVLVEDSDGTESDGSTSN